jgi:hypothetical protein
LLLLIFFVHDLAHLYTMDELPVARRIVWIHQLHVAGEEGGSAAMVLVFFPVGVCCGWLSPLFELIVECRKMVQNILKERLMPFLFIPCLEPF